MNISISRQMIYASSIVIVAAIWLLAVSPAAVSAGGEPGTGCGEGFKYDPPPFVGDLTLIWNEASLGSDIGYVTATGTVDQAGKADCSGVFSNTTIIEDVSIDDFLAWDANFLKGSCIENIGTFPFPCYGDAALFSVVAVGGMKWMGETFTAKFVIMHLK